MATAQAPGSIDIRADHVTDRHLILLGNGRWATVMETSTDPDSDLGKLCPFHGPQVAIAYRDSDGHMGVIYYRPEHTVTVLP